jgi:hypothetical protein
MENVEKKAARIGLTELLRIMRGAQFTITKNVNDSFLDPTLSPSEWQSRRRQVASAYQVIRTRWAEYAAYQIPKQYGLAVNATLKAMGKTITADIPFISTVNSIVLDTVARMNIATKNGQEIVESLFMRTQQAIVEDTLINSKIAEGLITNATPDNLQKVIHSEFAKKLNGGQVIEINGRMYQADKYSELVARTRTREAQTTAALDTVQSFGEDLVQWSHHNHEPSSDEDVCGLYEGRIFSISGTSEKYDTLTVKPPAHPNCTHVLTPHIE